MQKKRIVEKKSKRRKIQLKLSQVDIKATMEKAVSGNNNKLLEMNCVYMLMRTEADVCMRMWYCYLQNDVDKVNESVNYAILLSSLLDLCQEILGFG